MSAANISKEENDVLYNTFVKATEYLDAISKMASTLPDDTSLEDFPESVVDTEELYAICRCYIRVMSLLEKSDLAKFGYSYVKYNSIH